MKILVGLTILAISAPSFAATTAPATPDTAAPKPYTADVYVGPCVNPALNAEDQPNSSGSDGREGAFIAAIGSALIGKVFDWVGAGLTKLGEDQRTDLVGARASDLAFDGYYCIQIARPASNPDDGIPIDGLAAKQLTWAFAVQKPVNIPRNRSYDLFAEYWARPSSDGTSVSFVPSLLYYRKLLGKENGSSKGSRLVSIKVGSPASDPTSITWALPRDTTYDKDKLNVLIVASPGKSADGTMAFYRLKPAELDQTCETSCSGSSPWIKNPWAVPPAEGNAPQNQSSRVIAPGTLNAGYHKRPMNIEVTWTEIRDGSKFWKTVADVWNAQKQALQTQVEQSLFSGARQTAEQAALTDHLTTLTARTQAIAAAQAAQASYCSNKDVPKADWWGLSDALVTYQKQANSASGTANIPAPFPNPAVKSGTFQPSLCTG